MTTDNTTTTDRCTHGGDCTLHPESQGLHNYDDADLRAELEQWRATFGENALRDAQRIIAERDQLRAQVAFYGGPQKQPGRVSIVPAEQREPLYAAYKAAREWAEQNGESYTDDGIIQAAVKAYRAELIVQAKATAEQAAGVSA